MMNEMMHGGMGLMMPGMLLGTTLWLLLLAVLTWTLITWRNRRWSRPQPMLYTPQSPPPSQRDEQGSQPMLYTPQPPPPSQRDEQGYPIEPLSPQEQRVLRLLVAGRTYAEIAQALIVSPNTIKTQVSSIYRKLSVSRRAEAIAATQRLPLLIADGP
jgi:DNA-binding CsgD family transcriptional regulator